jgi:hypothetical protein
MARATVTIRRRHSQGDVFQQHEERDVIGGLIALFRRRFEAFDTFAYFSTKFGTLLGSKHEQGNSKPKINNRRMR